MVGNYRTGWGDGKSAPMPQRRVMEDKAHQAVEGQVILGLIDDG